MKTIKFILLAVVLLASSFSYAYANVVRLVFIDYSEMRESSERVYFSDALGADDELQIRDLLTRARSRIETHYGEVSARPAVVVLSEKEEFERYGLGSRPGMFLFTPWGDYLLLNYHKAGLDVVAHELVHAEVVQRVGYLKRQMAVPTWFDEGAAMQLDFRSRYLLSDAPDTAEFQRLTGLTRPSQFWRGEEAQIVQNYRSAKWAVSELIKHSEEGVYSILDRIRDGDTGVIDELARVTERTLKGPFPEY